MNTEPKGPDQGVNMFDPDKEFFVIQSDDLESVQTHFYGYCFAKTGFILNTSDLATGDGNELTGEGTYVSIHRNGDQIKVHQDYYGCYGLYLYRSGEYWALSNSFQYLVDALKYTHTITFNKVYADYFLTAGLSDAVYRATMVKEIELLDRSAEVSIDILTRACDVKIIDYHEHTVALDSPEGIAILDGWYNKWTALIQSLKQQTNNISTDLSGGFDSRMVFNLFLGSGINCSEIYVHSIHDDLHTHAEDWEIANQIANHYDFKLGNLNGVSTESVNYSLEDVLNLSLYTKLGFHKQMYWKTYRLRDYRFIFTGAGGEGVRRYWDSDLDDAVQGRREQYVSAADAFPDDRNAMRDNILHLFDDSLRIQQEKYCREGRVLSPDEKMMFLYRDIRGATHFGRSRVENLFGGMITLSPLLDQKLCRLKRNTEECDDRNLLMTLMFVRYNKKLAEIPFDSGRCIDPSTLEYARRLSQKYPVIRSEQQKPVIRITASATVPRSGRENKRVSKDQLRQLIRDSFFSVDVKRTFESLYSKRTYSRIAEYWEKTDFYPEQRAYGALAVSKIYRDCTANAWLQEEKTCVSNYIIRQAGYNQAMMIVPKPLYELPYMANYVTARIDFKNSGNEENDLRILELSDQSTLAASPDWYRHNGVGYLVHSDLGELTVKLQCIGDGRLTILLRGRDVRDRDGERVRFLIDYTKLDVNGQHVLDERKSTWHDRPFRYEKPVKDGEIITFSTAWQPHDETLQKDPYQESIQKELRQKDETITELKHDLAAAKRGGAQCA